MQLSEEKIGILKSGVTSLKQIFGEEPPQVLIELGTGYANAFEALKEREPDFVALGECLFSNPELMHFPSLTVPGHEGKIIMAMFGKTKVAIVFGRKHLYEGTSPDQVVRVARIFAQWGTERFVFTNAAGGMRLDYQVGDIVAIKDYYNASGHNVLVGINDPAIGNRFFSMANLCDKKFLADFKVMFGRCSEAYNEETFRLHTNGNYSFMLGPRFETALEIAIMRKNNLNLVGMSTHPQIEALAHMRTLRPNIKINGFSIISNLAEGMSSTPIAHDTVLEEVAKKAAFLGRVLFETIAHNASIE